MRNAVDHWARVAVQRGPIVYCVEALESVSGAAGNHEYLVATRRIQAEVAIGSSLNSAMQATDALVLVMPEYNRGYNAALKNAIDFLYAEWEGLPVGCVGYGWHGAEYAKSALRQTLEWVKMTVVDGPGLAFEKTLTQDGEVRAGEAEDAALAAMFADLVAKARPAS